MTRVKEERPDDSAGPDLEEVKTVCRDCCFAIYDEETQTGCKLNKIEKFRERGCQVVPAYDDTGREFFIIQDRFCVFWREPDWVESDAARIPKNHRSDDDVAKKVRRDVRAKFVSVVYFDKNSTLADLKKTLGTIKSGMMVPDKVVFCNNFSDIEPKDILKLARGTGCRWGIEKIASPDSNKAKCLDFSIKKIKSMDNTYYSFFSAGSKIPKNFYSDIDIAINDELLTFLALYPEKEQVDGDVPDGFVAQIHIHKQMSGNFKKPFLDKLKSATESQECQHLIKPLSEIVQSL